MTALRRWVGKFFGLQAAVEDQATATLGMTAAVAGEVARFEVAKEAEEFAAELDASHPHLAAAFRARVADSLGLPTPTPPALDLTPAPEPPALPAAVAKKTPSRLKKAAAAPGTDPAGPP